MPRTVTQISIFIGSPGDTQSERIALDEVIRRINDGVLAEDKRVVLRLVRWENDAWPGFGQDAQDVINQQIGPYDIFVGIMRNRLGTPTGRAASGSVEEFERAYRAWFKHKIPTVMLYFSKEPMQVAAVGQLDEIRKVLLFKERVGRMGGLFWEYESVDEFKRQVAHHLEQEILKHWSASPDNTTDISNGAPSLSFKLRQEKFLDTAHWPNLLVLGDWALDPTVPTVRGGGVYEYLLSEGEFGSRPFRIKTRLRFFDYNLHTSGIDNGNSGIIFGWKQTDGACSYLNLLFTGSRVLLEEVGSSGRDAYFDFQHLDAGSEFQLEKVAST